MNYLVESISPHFPEMTVVEGDSQLLVATTKNAILKCVDDRPVEGLLVSSQKTRGVAIQGGSLGHAYLSAITDQRGVLDGYYFEKALDIEIKSGARPGVHDLDSGKCKHGDLVMNGGFSGGPRVDMNVGQILEILKAKGGEQVRLSGSHKAKILRVNTRPDHTLVANGTSYNFDKWWAEYVGLDMDIVYKNLYQTATRLGVGIVEVLQ